MRAIQAAFSEIGVRPEVGPILVLVTGGRERDGYSRAEQAARQLVMRYGLPRNAVVLIGGEGSTLGNSAAAIEYLRASGAQDVTTLEIVTNDYHMLRAWFIFSRDMLLATTGTGLELPGEDFERIKEIVTRGLPSQDDWSQGCVKAVRASVMGILRPHFSISRVAVVPFVVEEVLERSHLKPEAAARYASLLRRSRWARDTLRLEYGRFVRLLSESVAR